MRVDVDVDNWPTKQEAAVQLRVSGNSIERLLRQRRLKKRIRRGTGLPVVVIDPKSIAECRQTRGDLADEETTNPTASVALARIVKPSLAPARSGATAGGLEAAFLAFLQSKTPSSIVPVERRIFLTITEAAEYSGLPAAFLRRLIASGKIKALRTGAGWRVSRVELETLSGTLTDTTEDLAEHELRDLEVNRRRRQGIINSDDLPGIG
jgi:excisionase family DNA binding protein